MPQPFSARPLPASGEQGLAELALISRMPERAADALRQIEGLWRETIDSSARAQSVDGATLRELERLVTRDAPDVVAAWLALPAGAVLDDGRSADAVFLGQVEVLRRAAGELSHRALQPARDGVAIEGTYLETKYRPNL